MAWKIVGGDPTDDATLPQITTDDVDNLPAKTNIPSPLLTEALYWLKTAQMPNSTDLVDRIVVNTNGADWTNLVELATTVDTDGGMSLSIGAKRLDDFGVIGLDFFVAYSNFNGTLAALDYRESNRVQSPAAGTQVGIRAIKRDPDDGTVCIQVKGITGSQYQWSASGHYGGS